MPLTDTAIRNAKPGITPSGGATRKPYKMGDERGLYLEVSPNGGKWWRFKYRFEGKEKRLSLGVYPDVSLKDARERRDALRKQVASEIDPGVRRKAEKTSKAEAGANSFEVIAREWHTKQSTAWVKSTAIARLTRLDAEVFPAIGSKPISEVSAPEILKILRRSEGRGAHEVARRVRQMIGQIFRYAIATGSAERDPSADLRGALVPTVVRHHSALTQPRAVGALMRAMAGYQGEPVTQAALRFAPLVFVRSGELRAAQWDEFDLDAAEWRIPAARMKMREEHIVPLSRQAVAVLRDIHELTGRWAFVFPSIRSRPRPMSENTINAALRRMGYTREEMTGHGFRSMASTLLNEQGWNRDAIERQLAHAERDDIRAAYNRAGHLPERRKMMQAWADYLDALRTGAEIVPLHRKG